MIIRDMTIEDVKYLKLPAEWMREKYIQGLSNTNDPAWLMEHEGRILCGFGAAKLWDGVFEIWFNLIRTENVISMLRILKKFIIKFSKVSILEIEQTVWSLENNF